MCLIIASQNGVLEGYQIVRRGFEDNPDSWGIMRSNGRRVDVDRGFTWAEFERAYAKLNGDPYVIHFRFATHGGRDLANCHPFKVSNRLYMAHNGIINIKQENPRMSDTWHYAKRLRYQGITDANLPDSVPMIRAEIGRGNKIAFLSSAGAITIANRDAGVERGDVWLSNGNSLFAWEDDAAWVGDGFDGYYGECEYCLTDDWLSQVDVDGDNLELCGICSEWARRRLSALRTAGAC